MTGLERIYTQAQADMIRRTNPPLVELLDRRFRLDITRGLCTSHDHMLELTILSNDLAIKRATGG